MNNTGVIDWSQKVSSADAEMERDAAARAEMKSIRQDLVNKITVNIGGLVFNGDEVSQSRMMRVASVVGADDMVEWILADNGVRNVTGRQLMAAAKSSAIKMAEIWVDDQFKNNL
ncbi:hypothetical protein ABKY47_002989 [Aeromonas hydrophila]